MEEFAEEIIPVNLVDELRRSYLDYAMSVIIGRALPDVRDGLKPVHRRALYAMHELGNEWNKPYKKSARVVGDVIGKYHPHGDAAVYDTIVRMAQTFSMRYMLVDGQGNFGSIDGDAPAAMRYTEVRMAKIAHDLLVDINKNTVDSIPNYDNSEQEPTVLPTKIPNLLVNGSSGIAVGMATNIPPHNLNEVIDTTLALIDNPEIDIDALMQSLPGPDFPTAGLICNRQGIYEAYRTGRGRIVMRARCHTESAKNGSSERIVVTELPYIVNKARLLEKIAELVKSKRIEGISELRDESNKEGIRVVIELKRGEISGVILNNLYRHTALQNSFNVNMVVLDNGQPVLANLKQVISAFVRHRRDVVTRRSIFELQKARNRLHILEAQAVALANIDKVIALIKASQSPPIAKQELVKKAWKPGEVIGMLERGQTSEDDHAISAAMTRPEDLSSNFGLRDGKYYLSDVQAQAILDLRLHRLTALEQDKIVSDYKILIEEIKTLLKTLSDPDTLMQVIRSELSELKEKYGDSRRTEILDYTGDLSIEDLITEEDTVVTFSRQGYVKRQDMSNYRAQKRGGKGKTATAMKEEDFIESLFIAGTHDTLLCFSTLGRVYWLKVHCLPQASRAARGKPIVNLLHLSEKERISAVLPVKNFAQDRFVLMATQQGIVKKIPLSAFVIQRSKGKLAIRLEPEDQLVAVALTDGNHEVMLFSDNGKAVRFHESKLRPMGRNAKGNRGIKLKSGAEVISLICFDSKESASDILIACANGYGKRTNLSEFSSHNRNTAGVIAIKTSERNGIAVNAILVDNDDEIMLITTNGTLVRTKVKDISCVSRNTQGVRLIRLNSVTNERLVEAEKVPNIVEEMSEEITGENNSTNGMTSAD